MILNTLPIIPIPFAPLKHFLKLPLFHIFPNSLINFQQFFKKCLELPNTGEAIFKLESGTFTEIALPVSYKLGQRPSG